MEKQLQYTGVAILTALISSCGPLLSAPVMSLGTAYEGVMVAEHIPGKYAEHCDVLDIAECTTPVYKVANQHYVAGKAVSLRERKLRYWHAADIHLHCNYTRTSANEPIAYYPVMLAKDSAGNTYCQFEQDIAHPLTTLPEQARKPVGFYPFNKRYTSHCACNGHAHNVKITKDSRLTPHALYAYPAAALLFVGVDLPCGIVITIGGLIYGSVDEMLD